VAEKMVGIGATVSLGGEGWDAGSSRDSPSFPRAGTLREARSMATTTAIIALLRNIQDIELRVITFNWALAFCWRVGRPSPFRPLLERASFRVDRAPKTKNPTARFAPAVGF